MNKTKIISGMAVHCHHKILFDVFEYSIFGDSTGQSKIGDFA